MRRLPLGQEGRQRCRDSHLEAEGDRDRTGRRPHLERGHLGEQSAPGRSGARLRPRRTPRRGGGRRRPRRGARCRARARPTRARRRRSSAVRPRAPARRSTYGAGATTRSATAVTQVPTVVNDPVWDGAAQPSTATPPAIASTAGDLARSDGSCRTRTPRTSRTTSPKPRSAGRASPTRTTARSPATARRASPATVPITQSGRRTSLASRRRAQAPRSSAPAVPRAPATTSASA